MTVIWSRGRIFFRQREHILKPLIRWPIPREVSEYIYDRLDGLENWLRQTEDSRLGYDMPPQSSVWLKQRPLADSCFLLLRAFPDWLCDDSDGVVFQLKPFRNYDGSNNLLDADASPVCFPQDLIIGSGWEDLHELVRAIDQQGPSMLGCHSGILDLLSIGFFGRHRQ